MKSKCFVLLLFSTCLLIPGRAYPGFRICFRQDDDNSQYQGISESCSGYSSQKNPGWSSPFRDDTGGKSGRHTYQWRVEAGDQIRNFTEYRLCFSAIGKSDRKRSSCTGWSRQPGWTQPFYDYTNASPGHCRYSWMIQSRPYCYPSRFKVCLVCFKEPLGSSQRQGTRRSCSGWAAPGRNPSNPWIVHQFHLLFSVQQIAHVKKYSNRSQRMLLLVKRYKKKKNEWKRNKQWFTTCLKS